MNLKSNNPLPKVSIIVPAYNNGEYIGEALDSVIAQTYPHWECIVVDDGSTDNTWEIVAEYCQKESRVTYLYQENSGPSVARNNGIANTSGEFILPLDADDKIADTYLEKAVNHFIQHPETTLVYCRTELFGLEDGEYYRAAYKYDEFIYNNCFVCTAMYKRSDYLNTTGYNPNMTLGLEDWDFWISLLSPESIVHRLDELLFYYRIKQTSRNVTCGNLFHNQMRIQLIQNHPDIYNVTKLFLSQINNNILRQELLNLRHSHAYRIGKCIVRPFAFFKKKLRNKSK